MRHCAALLLYFFSAAMAWRAPAVLLSASAASSNAKGRPSSLRAISPSDGGGGGGGGGRLSSPRSCTSTLSRISGGSGIDGGMVREMRRRAALGWAERADAAGSNRALVVKAFLEVSLAVTFQLLAEIERRRGAFWAESDYVVAGILTAVVGKVYAAWRTAPTKKTDRGGDGNSIAKGHETAGGAGGGLLWRDVPTNAFAFGEYSGLQRSLALVKPAPQLFLVGGASSFVGYGIASLLSAARPAGEAPPLPPVPVLGAALYGGAFLVTVSNLSFQLYQGLLEGRLVDPAVSRLRAAAARRDAPRLAALAGATKWLLVACGRAARGTVVSGLAIRGMQLSGLQQRSSPSS